MIGLSRKFPVGGVITEEENAGNSAWSEINRRLREAQAVPALVLSAVVSVNGMTTSQVD